MKETYAEETGLLAEVASVDIAIWITMSRWGFGLKRRVGFAGSESGKMHTSPGA